LYWKTLGAQVCVQSEPLVLGMLRVPNLFAELTLKSNKSEPLVIFQDSKKHHNWILGCVYEAVLKLSPIGAFET
jgi:hypothetical protein